MSNKIKIIALILAMITVFGAFASCTSGGDGETTTTQQGNENPADTDPEGSNGPVNDDPIVTTDKYSIGTNIPSDVKFEGETVIIGSRGDVDWCKDEITVEYISGGVSDTVYVRQTQVEELLGITIDNQMISSGGQYELSEHLRNDAKNNDYRYDIVANSVYSTIMYTGEGIFADLTSLEYLDLSRPYWSQGFNEAAEIGTAQYMCTGAAALTMFRYMFVTFFNKTLVKQYGDVNFYDVVNNYEWTLDYQIEYCERFADSVNETLGAEGIYGFVSRDGNTPYIDAYWSACKLPMIVHDEDGWLKMGIDTERMVDAVDKILRLYSDSNLGTYIYGSEAGSDDGTQATIAAHLAADRAATVTLRLCSVEGAELKNMESEYGIIPIPMLNKEQKEYGTILHDQVTAIGVYSRVAEERLPMLGAFLETFAAKSYELVVPAYYDIALKNRYLKDDESAQMLDLIYESVYIDPGILYTKNINVAGGSISQKIRAIVTSGKNTVASDYGVMQVYLADQQLIQMQESIKKLQGEE